VDAERLHELSAAYALDALGVEEREAYQAHLAECERCRDEVAEFSSVAASLAHAVEPAAPSPALRERILEAARAERPNVLPLRPRWAYPAAAAAAVAACAAVALGIWGLSLDNRAGNSNAQAIERVAVSGAQNSFVVYSGQSAGLVLSGLAAAPSGKTYEAWVIEGKLASPAGLFRGGSPTTYVAIGRKVPKGSVVAVTVEPAGGSARPTTKPFVVSMPV
jgi:anti-sigma-K factor RskA